MTTTTSFATAKEVATAMASLGYQVPAETLLAISRHCRDDFLGHLSKCISGQDTEGTSKKAIGNLIRCLAPETISRLKSVVPHVTIDMVVPLASKRPMRLLSAIDAATLPTHERHADAKELLGSVFNPSANDTAMESPSASTENTGQEQIPSVRSMGEKPATSAERSGERDSKRYNSCHVYGSGYALCFNAGEWEGKRGVMVDAAVSSGPKTYDWKNSVHIWLDTNEVGAVLAVFRRWRKGIEFNAHGAANDKSFAIEFQGQHFYAKVQSRKAANHPTRAVKILPTDATEVSILFLTQLADSYPAIPLNELLATVRATHQISDATAS